MKAEQDLIVMLIVLTVIIGIILWRIFIIGPMDRRRIMDDARSKGWNIKSITWSPFGPGWIGEKNDRIYSVEFTNKNGKASRKYCKTSVFSGVYWK